MLFHAMIPGNPSLFYDIKRRINQLTENGGKDVDIRLILLGVGPDSLAFNLSKICPGGTFTLARTKIKSMITNNILIDSMQQWRNMVVAKN